MVNTILQIFSTIGGAGFFAGFLVWLVQNLIQYSQEKKKQRLSQTNNLQMAFTNNQIDRKTHIYYKLAEAEFDALQKLWSSMFEYSLSISALIPVLDQYPKELVDQSKEYLNRFNKFATAYNNLVNVLYCSKPIICIEIYQKAEEILDIGRKCGIHFQVYFCCDEFTLPDSRTEFWKEERKTQEYRNTEKAFVEKRDQLGEMIRKRYEELSKI